MPSILNNAHAYAVSVARGGRGLHTRPSSKPAPEQLLELYDFEACPFCRKVREAMTELDLDYTCRNAPRGAVLKRKQVIERGGRMRFPYLVDPNADVAMNESEDIITYLCASYGASKRSNLGRALAPINTLSSFVASSIRPRGRRVRRGLESRQQPEQLLELYNMEGSPYCRKVRETLAELNLDYIVRNVGKRGARRHLLVERGGKMQVPFLIDPNRDADLYESQDIVDYLEANYA